MRESRVNISIIVPTHNRRRSVEALLEGLCVQTFPASKFEVIVVSNACTDDTHRLAGEDFPFSFTLLQTPTPGAAAARNLGAAEAKGAILLFLDDDILPDTQLVEKHVLAHHGPADVVIGYLPFRRQADESLFRMSLQAWWEEKFHRMSLPGHRFSFEDLLGGNFSLPESLFSAVGGFNSRFDCVEDYELGVRLMKAGAHFKYEKKAWGWHNDTATDLQRSLQRKREEGRAHVQLCRLYPDAIHRFRLWALLEEDFKLNQLPKRNANVSGRKLRLANWYDRHKFRGHWKKLNHRLHDAAYLSGVLEAAGSRQDLETFISQTKEALQKPPITVDLQDGPAAAFAKVESLRPDSLQLTFGAYKIGEIPYACDEPLRALHLKQYLFTTGKKNYLAALAFDLQFVDSLVGWEPVTSAKEKGEMVDA